MDRRKFLTFFGVGTVASSLPVAIASCYSLLNIDAAFGQSGGFVKVASKAELEQNGQILDKSIPILVVRAANQRLVAVNPTCTHRGCTVEWSGDTESFVCPCHEAKFDVNGQVLQGPAKNALNTYNVKIEDNSILVRKI